MNDQPRFYPWHEKHREQLVRLHAAEKLPHALLLSGPAWLGKRDFAFAMGALLLCQSPTEGSPCGVCSGCHLLAAGTHPDFHVIEPEESRLIKIEQVRDLIDWVNQTAQRGGFKVVVIHPAEQMNVHSANALLKCLEEPTDRTLIMLVSDLPGRLLPTIRSRCRHLNFPIPAADIALDWLRSEHAEIDKAELLLAVAGGAPLAVTDHFDAEFLARRAETGKALGRLVRGESPLVVARALASGEVPDALDIMHSLFADALRQSVTGDEKSIKNKDMKEVVGAISRALGARGLMAALDAVIREQQAVAGPSNPNVQLLMEALLIEVAGLCAL